MNHVFLQLKPNFVFRQEPLKKIAANDGNKEALLQIIQKFYQ
jgi:hypothetical protein